MAIWWDRRDGHLFPISQMTKCNAHGFPKVMQIWKSRTTHAQEAATVDGRVLSPCWPHEYAERVFWESSKFSNNKPALQLYLNLIRKGPWQIFLLGLAWALSNQVLKPVGEHHNQLLNPNCLAALERPRLRIMRLCYLQTALGNPHPALVSSGWVQPRLMQNLQHPEGLQSSENEGEVTQPRLTAGGTECVCVWVC